MSADAKLVVLFAGLHLLGLILVGVLLVLFLRSDATSPWSPGDDEAGGGGGGNDRLAPRDSRGPRGGGLPLPDAAPARARLREPVRLAELVSPRPRRGTPEPARTPAPQRTPARRRGFSRAHRAPSAPRRA